MAGPEADHILLGLWLLHSVWVGPGPEGDPEDGPEAEVGPVRSRIANSADAPLSSAQHWRCICALTPASAPTPAPSVGGASVSRGT